VRLILRLTEFVTGAEIISFLSRYRQSLRKVIDNMEIWVTRITEERKEAKNEA
jgi:hypothetical protein